MAKRAESAGGRNVLGQKYKHFLVVSHLIARPPVSPARPRTVSSAADAMEAEDAAARRARLKAMRADADESLRNGVHHANGVVWEPVYRARLRREQRQREDDHGDDADGDEHLFDGVKRRDDRDERGQERGEQ